jgi:hypothetical protein
MAGTGNYGGSLARSGSCTVYSNQLFGSVREDAMQEPQQTIVEPSRRTTQLEYMHMQLSQGRRARAVDVDV